MVQTPRMTLPMETYRNASAATNWRAGGNAGGQSAFKALGHPLAMPLGRALAKYLHSLGTIAALDLGDGLLAGFAAMYGLDATSLAGVYVQRWEDVGKRLFDGAPQAQPLAAIAASPATAVFAPAFDPLRAQRLAPALGGKKIITLKSLRLPDARLAAPRRYLDPLNFATNFALWRDLDKDDIHTRLTGVNYWGLYGADAPSLLCMLFADNGRLLAEWEENPGPAGGVFELDSREIRARFDHPDVVGSLFLHALRPKGHDIVKYALDTFGQGSSRALSATHDANAWPADFYAGIPAPEDDETLTLFVQNSHPTPIPKNTIVARPLGYDTQGAAYPHAIPPFGTAAMNLGALVPELRFPQQIEIVAGRWFVRPRYEVVRQSGARRIAHANVERTDLTSAPDLPALTQALGKGFIVPLPVPPVAEYTTTIVPAPMARGGEALPIAAKLYDASGVLCGEKYLGHVPRTNPGALDIAAWMAQDGITLPSGYGAVQVVYDFRDGGEGDGWLHALARFERKASGHRAETIFGAHLFNIASVWRDEPQSYAGDPPGLSTRLFLRLAPNTAGMDTICMLIYPASDPQAWLDTAEVQLDLTDMAGATIASATRTLPRDGCLLFRPQDIFAAQDLAKAPASLRLRAPACRLFGYHGLVADDGGFSLDHMFGF